MLIDMKVNDVLVDSLIRPECLFRPGSFTGLMTIYESNYIRLRKLLPDVDAFSRERVSYAPRDCDLHARVVDQQSYTTTLKLTYEFPEADGTSLLDPDLTVRVYHDARLAEAMAVCTEHRHEKIKELARSHSHRELGRRWQSNMMLNKWLDYLADMGHSLALR
jgi:uncharacterized protein YqiB (DUF1249 family)